MKMVSHCEAFLAEAISSLRKVEIASLRSARNDMTKCVFVQSQAKERPYARTRKREGLVETKIPNSRDRKLRKNLSRPKSCLPSKDSTSRSPGLQLQTYLPRLPIPILIRTVAACGFRSCLQLRGSAGITPASISKSKPDLDHPCLKSNLRYSIEFQKSTEK